MTKTLEDTRNTNINFKLKIEKLKSQFTFDNQSQD
jgi:hypothetical protein